MDRMDYIMDDGSQPPVNHIHNHPCHAPPIHLPQPSQFGSRASTSREGQPFDPVHDSTFSNQLPPFQSYGQASYQPHLSHPWNPTPAQLHPDGHHILPYTHTATPSGLPDPRSNRPPSYLHTLPQPFATSNVRGYWPETPTYTPIMAGSTGPHLPQWQQDQSQFRHRIQQNRRQLLLQSQNRAFNNEAPPITPLAPNATNFSNLEPGLVTPNTAMPRTRISLAPGAPRIPHAEHSGRSSTSQPIRRPTNQNTSANLGEGNIIISRNLGHVVPVSDEDLETIMAFEGNPRFMTALHLAIPDDGKKRPSKEALDSLIKMTVDEVQAEGEEINCMICYNDFGTANPEGVTEQPLRLPKCKHIFGDICIKQWFEEQDTCPYCRDKLPSEVSSKRSRVMERLMLAHAARRGGTNVDDETVLDAYSRRLHHRREAQRQFNEPRGASGSSLRSRRRPALQLIASIGTNSFGSPTPQTQHHGIASETETVANLMAGSAQESSGSSNRASSSVSENQSSPAVVVGSSPSVNVRSNTTDQLASSRQRLSRASADDHQTDGWTTYAEVYRGGNRVGTSGNAHNNQENTSSSSRFDDQRPSSRDPVRMRFMQGTNSPRGTPASADWADFAQRWST